MTWEQAWQEQRTGWDAGQSSPILRALVEDDVLPNGRALVPGCGAGYDVLTLAAPERTAIGVDLAPTAAARFRALRDERNIAPEHAQIRVGSFFDLDLGGPFDLIFDYTFLCAIEPEMRSKWATRMHDLLTPEGELVTLVFPVRHANLADTREDPQGPPYAMHPELLRELLTPRFTPIVLEPAQHSHPGRVGKEWLGRWRKKS